MTVVTGKVSDRTAEQRALRRVWALRRVLTILIYKHLEVNRIRFFSISGPFRVQVRAQYASLVKRLERRRGLDSANLKRHQDRQGRDRRIRELLAALIAKNPDLGLLTQHKLAPVLEREWAKAKKGRVSVKTIKRALGPAKKRAKSS